RKPLVPAAAILLLLVQRRAEIGGLYPTVSASAFYPRIGLLEKIPRGAPYRVAALDYTFIPNIAALYELEDVRGYEAMTFAPLARTFPLWCVAQPVWFNRVDDPTKPFLSFLNVRYVLDKQSRPTPPGWNVLGEEGAMRLLENPRALERVFVPRWVAREGQPARVLERLHAIRDFGEAGVLLDAPATLSKNGEARVEITAATAQRMELSIDARERSVIGTSVTAWPGWRLTIDGGARPLLSYNHAFLGFEVAPGRHRAELAYRPRSFSTGLWISGLTLAAVLASVARARVRLSGTGPPRRREPARPATGP
ncbi:MAG TPA: YfhO family protein, partial [Thermoanaerobaculia bacterium]